MFSGRCTLPSDFNLLKIVSRRRVQLMSKGAAQDLQMHSFAELTLSRNQRIVTKTPRM